MNVQDTATPKPLPDPQRQSNAADLRQGGRWLLLVRVAWIVVFVLSLAVFIADLLISSLDLVSSLLLVTATSVWFAVSGMLLWSKSNDRVVVLFSLAFMLIGGVLLPNHPAAYLAGHSWVRELFLALFQSLAQAALLLFYLFPDGHFVPRWTRFLAFGWIIVSLDQNVPSFLTIGAFNPWNAAFPYPLFRSVEVAFYGSFIFSLLYRYRRMSTPVQRQQTKWVIFAFLIILVVASVSGLELDVIPSYFPALTLPNQLVPLVYSLTYWVLPVLGPVAIGIALLRYRLWTIDLIIKRTLVYGLLTGTLTVVYIGAILLLEGLLGSFTNGNTLALVGSTLAIVVLFIPVRRRIQTSIDRRFYRRTYNATRTIEAFSATLRKEIDLNTLSEQLVAVVQETMQPTHVSLWLPHPQARKPPGGLVTAEKAPPQQPIGAEHATETAGQMPGPSSRRISRRAAMIGLAAGGIVVAGGDLSWWLLLRHPIFTYTRHSDTVFAVAWSPDGRRIATGSGDRTVQVWDAADGGHVFTYRGHSNWVHKVAWSPDGRRIASCSEDRTVQVWDAADGSHVFTYRGHSAEVFAVAWSPDGRRIASCSNDHTVQVWDAADGGHVFTYRGHSNWVHAVAWSPDGRRIASCSEDRTVQIWDAADGGHVFTYRGHSGWVHRLAWSPDGRRIASGGGDWTVQVWDATDGSHVFTYRGHIGNVDEVAWSPDGRRIASGGADHTVQVWDAVEAGHVFTYYRHADSVGTVAWSPDGRRIASGSADKTVQIWSPG